MRPALSALAALGLAAAGCSVLDPMMGQQKVKPYAESRFYPDGMGMRAPPPGTVEYRAPLDPALAEGLAPDGGPLDAIPVPLTRPLLDEGRRRFEIICAACHGLLGDGDSPVARNMSLRPPPSLHDRILPDGYTFRVISQGFGLMPSYANQLAPEQRWAVVAYLRALRLSQSARLSDLPPPVRARLEKEPP